MKKAKKIYLKIFLIFFFSINTENIYSIIYGCDDSSLSSIKKIATLNSFIFFHDHILIKQDTFFNPRFDLYHAFIDYFLDKIGMKTNVQIDKFMAQALSNSQPKINNIAQQTIKTLQENNIKVFAISHSKTGPWHGIQSKENHRINELNNCGFNFSSAFDVPYIHFILKEDAITHPPFLKNGIIFTNNNSEEIVLHTFFNWAQKQIAPIPNKIIYVDNNLDLIKANEQIFAKNYPQTEFVGIYYPINNPPRKACVSDILKFEIQIEKFQKDTRWFNDEEILQAIQNWTPYQQQELERYIILLSHQF